LLGLQIMAARPQNVRFWEACVPDGHRPTSAQNGGSGAVATSIQSHFVTDLAGFRLFLSTASGQI